MNSSKNAIHESYDKIKTLYLALAHSAIIAAYSFMRPMKTGIFTAFVGVSYQPTAKMVSFILAPILMYFYSMLLNKMPRHKVATILFGIYAVAIAISSVFMLSPSIGLANKIASPTRLFGWSFYLFLDFFNVFVLETFWSFTNSISSPHFAREKYSIISAVARLAGIAAPLVGWILLNDSIQEIIAFPTLCLGSSILLTIAIICFQRIASNIPEEFLSGYSRDHEPYEQDESKKSSWLDGFKLLTKEPYVLGIFIMIYSFNFVSTFADFQMQTLVSAAYNGEAKGVSRFGYIYTAIFQVLGFFLSWLGTSTVLKRFGLTFCLMISPFITFALLLLLIGYKSLAIATFTMIIFRALNYGFNVPVREMLFIPTTETIQFKSKAWINSLGQTLSEGLSSFFNNPNMLSFILPGAATSTTAFSAVVSFLGKARPAVALFLTGGWFITAHFLGQKYQDTVTHNKIIGRRSPKKDL